MTTTTGTPGLLRFDANLKWLFTELPFERRFDAAAAAGFTAVEFASPYEYPAAEVRRRLDDAGLAQVLINTPAGAPGMPGQSGYACLPDRVDEFRAGVRQGLEYAVALGAPLLHVLGGIVAPGVSRQRAFARYVANIAWAGQQAADAGVRLVLEAQNGIDTPGYILRCQEEAAAAAEAVDGVGVLMDFYHLQVGEGDVVRTFERFRDRVLHIQIADPPARTEPGTGEIGWTAVFDAVRRSGYTGWIGCEYRPRSGTVAGLGWLEEWL